MDGKRRQEKWMLDADRDLFWDRVHTATIFMDIISRIPKCQISSDSRITYLRAEGTLA